MLCALTVRKLKPGAFDEFKQVFFPPEGVEAPAGWKRFYAIRNVDNEDEVVTFGVFDGTREELESGQEEGRYKEMRQATDQLVESVSANGIYEIMEERSME